MTEAEFFALPMERRQTMPWEEILDVTLRTLEDMHETLAIEGFEFVGFDVREGDPGEEPSRSEVWTRAIGGKVEWFDVWEHGPSPDTDPERIWLRTPSPIDPRLIVD